MHLIRNVLACLALSIACLGVGHAEQTSGSGAGYYGLAEYSDGGGATVGPYDTWIECSNALEAAVDNAASNNADNAEWTVVSVSGCGYFHHYIAHASEPAPQLAQFDVVAGSPWDSARKVHSLLRRVRELRARHAADEYEAALIAISRSSAYE